MVTVLFGLINSYTDLGLFLTGADITEPEAKRTIVDVPGRDGQLDLSSALSPTMKFYNRTIKFVFKAVDYSNDWMTLYENVARALHGKNMHVTLSSDPDWYWDSFVTVEHHSEFNLGTIEVTCDAYPYRLQDHSLPISSPMSETIVNNGVTDIVPTITTDASITLKVNNGTTVTLAAGTYTDTRFKMNPGNNTFVSTGDANVTIAYTEKKL